MSNIFEPKIIRSSRRSISIQIERDGEIIVKAPRFMPMFLIRQFISAKQEWIEKTLEKVNARLPKKKKYKHGEEFLYLGNVYALHLGNHTEITVTTTLNFPKFLEFRIEKELRDWYMQKAKEKIMERLQYHSKQMSRDYRDVIFSDTISKWGTCWPDNSLQFNFRLIMAPLVVLDYVVIHELAHTKEKNHSARFWKIVANYTPAYKTHRKWLHTNSHLLHF